MWDHWGETSLLLTFPSKVSWDFMDLQIGCMVGVGVGVEKSNGKEWGSYLHYTYILACFVFLILNQYEIK